MSWVVAYVVVAWIIRVGMVPVILGREFAPGASLAWLGIVFLHPYIGLGLYLLVGETRLGPHRVERHRELVQKYRSAVHSAGPSPDSRPSELPAAYEPMVLQAEKISGMPIVGGNDVEFIGASQQMIDRLVADIGSAKSHVHLLYYMFAPDTSGTRVADAVIDAARRGVSCRVLVDAVASRTFFERRGLARRLRRRWRGDRLSLAGRADPAQAAPNGPSQPSQALRDRRSHRIYGKPQPGGPGLRRASRCALD